MSQPMFKPGDVVTLTSNAGPVMTVESVESDTCFCLWFVEGKLERHKFRCAALKLH